MGAFDGPRSEYPLGRSVDSCIWMGKGRNSLACWGRLVVPGALIAVLGCAGRGTPSAERSHTFVTDSAHYTVRRTQGLYQARIGFRYANHSKRTVSSGGCHGPHAPALEKRVGGAWVNAYNGVEQLCETWPPFRVRSGAQYDAAFFLKAAPKGWNLTPSLAVDSIPGTYRFRWFLRDGPDPRVAETPVIELISNEFQLELAPTDSSAR
jgi:hypothetical protein